MSESMLSMTRPLNIKGDLLDRTTPSTRTTSTTPFGIGSLPDQLNNFLTPPATRRGSLKNNFMPSTSIIHENCTADCDNLAAGDELSEFGGINLQQQRRRTSSIKELLATTGPEYFDY